MYRDETISDSKTETTNLRAADKLIARIEADILNGNLCEGETLPSERQIMETHSVSRTVVREAVQALANKGLVEAKPRFRPVVRKPGYDAALETVNSVAIRLLNVPGGVKNLFDTRIMIETSLVRQAATDATKDDIRALGSALQANNDAIHDSELFYKTDMNFHQILYQIPQNPLLPALHRAYTSWLAPQWSKMPRSQTRNEENFNAHKAIYDAILLRDPDLAEEKLRGHLDKAWKQVKATFKDL